MNRINSASYNLRSEVDKEELDSGVRYVLPFEEETVHRVFDSVSRALWCLQSIADRTDDDTYNSAFVRARRRFGRVFKHAYEYEFAEKKSWKLPTVKDIHSDFVWHNGLNARTFVLEKTEDSLVLEYRYGFKAEDETLVVDKEEKSNIKHSGIKACGDGVKHEHAPFNPSYFEKWRYNPSSFAFSIKSDDENVKIGVRNNSPNTPLWYRFYEPLTITGGLYARVTFDMTQQTDVVQFVHNRNHEPEV
jgi:hypothetical protein